MPNYVLAYRGGKMPEDQTERDAGLAAWGAWYAELGANAVDMGAPFSPVSIAVGEDGSTISGALSQLSGYSIVSAESIDGAVAAAKMCPILRIGGTVDVYETFSMM